MTEDTFEQNIKTKESTQRENNQQKNMTVVLPVVLFCFHE
jgi:hypothetical protein